MRKGSRRKAGWPTYGLILLGCLASGPAWAGGNAKVTVCHVPPGNPDNFHTIEVGENAYAAHLAHGDHAGPCDALCALLCDDEDACTIDDYGDCESLGCPTSPEQIDCSDGNDCTADSCDPEEGCKNTPLLGEPCDDGQVCTGPDVCNAEGQCTGTTLPGCCLSNEDCSSPNLCAPSACDLLTNTCYKAPVECLPGDLCSLSECDPGTGECIETRIRCRRGEICNPETGECGPPLPACFDPADYAGTDYTTFVTACDAQALCPNGHVDCKSGALVENGMLDSYCAHCVVDGVECEECESIIMGSTLQCANLCNY